MGLFIGRVSVAGKGRSEDRSSRHFRSKCRGLETESLGRQEIKENASDEMSGLEGEHSHQCFNSSDFMLSISPDPLYT